MKNSSAPNFSVFAVPSNIFRQGEDLAQFVFKHLPAEQFGENSVLAITSKIVALAENAVVAKDSIDKLTLIKNESDHFLCEAAWGTTLTIKHGILIPSAGIDESNSANQDYILFPKNPYASAQRLYAAMKTHYQLKNFGVIITDSHTHPLRRGVTGIGLAHWGFKSTRKLIGRPDLFGRDLKMTYVNVLDALAVSAVYLMGESNECTPMAVIQNGQVEFSEDIDPADIQIPWAEDIYKNLYEPLIKK